MSEWKPGSGDPINKNLRVTRVLRRTRLSGRPRAPGGQVALAATLFLLLGSVIYWSGRWQADSLFPAIPDRVFEAHEYWRLFTALVAHADMKHLLSNSLMFYILGWLLFGYFGAAVFPLAPFILGAAVNAMALITYPPSASLIGASGMVYVMGGMWLTLYGFVERKLSFPKRMVRFFGVGLGLWMPTAFEPNVSYRTHGIGFVVGCAFALAWFAVKRRELRAAEVWDTVVEDDGDEPGGGAGGGGGGSNARTWPLTESEGAPREGAEARAKRYRYKKSAESWSEDEAFDPDPEDPETWH